MAGRRMVLGPFTYLGSELTDGKLYHYASGTTTLRNVYTDLALTSAAAQPLLSDANGVFTFFADDSALYKFVLKDSVDATISTWDEWNVGYTLPSTVLNPSAGTTGYNLTYDGSDTIWVKPPAKQEVVLNGDMLLAQRGTSFAAIVSGSYHLDRWGYFNAGTMVHTVTQDSSAPTLANIGGYVSTSLKVDCTTADASIASTDYALIMQRIEGYRARTLFSQVWTIQWWAKATKTGTYCLGIRNGGLDRSIAFEYTVATTDTWAAYSATIPALDITAGGTWDTADGTGYDIMWSLAGGSTLHVTTAESWEAGNLTCTANQVNACDDAANDFYLTAVQIDLGAVARPFRPPPFDQTLEDCLRYYRKSYDYAVAPGTASSVEGSISVKANGTAMYVPVSWELPMRDAPTVTLYSPNTGTAAKWRDNTAAGDLTATAGEIGEKGFRVAITSSVDGNDTSGHYTADAEL